MKRLVIWTVLGAVLLAGAASAAADPKRSSKTDLASSYKPAVVNGMPWYRGAAAVKLHNERRGAKARPIVFLRILGEFDGAT